MNLLITIEPGKRSGQPCVRRMRITVRDVLEYLAGGMTVSELLAEFPELTADDIRACRAFAANQLPSQAVRAPDRSVHAYYLGVASGILTLWQLTFEMSIPPSCGYRRPDQAEPILLNCTGRSQSMARQRPGCRYC
jgi:uncharacterized protein (DUF433 family)